VLGLIATRSLTGEVSGIKPLVERAKTRIINGLAAYDAVEKLKTNPKDLAARQTFETTKNDLGYAMLLKRFVADPRQADTATIDKAAWSTVPNVPVLFWLFRGMAGLGFFFIAFFAVALYQANVRKFDQKWFLRAAVLIIPLPWLAAEIGWLVAEVGRQPWAVDGVLPTFLGASSLTIPQIWTTIAGSTLLYGVLAVIEVRLMLASIRKGPELHAPLQPGGRHGGSSLHAVPAE
jgi:cytochrome d ubiquinol oxidase subunit I